MIDTCMSAGFLAQNSAILTLIVKIKLDLQMFVCVTFPYSDFFLGMSGKFTSKFTFY